MIKKTANNWTRTLGLILILAICGKASAAPVSGPIPAIAGSKVSYETNPASHTVTYSGTNGAGTYTIVVTQIRSGRESVEKGQYEVQRSKGGWAIKHKDSNGNFSFSLEFTVTKTTGNGFQAKGNVFDLDGHPALHGSAPFDFNFVKAQQ